LCYHFQTCIEVGTTNNLREVGIRRRAIKRESTVSFVGRPHHKKAAVLRGEQRVSQN
jgi:hypothetical protein